jgi:hypothetical protein
MTMASCRSAMREHPKTASALWNLYDFHPFGVLAGDGGVEFQDLRHFGLEIAGGLEYGPNSPLLAGIIQEGQNQGDARPAGDVMKPRLPASHLLSRPLGRKQQHELRRLFQLFDYLGHRLGRPLHRAAHHREVQQPDRFDVREGVRR